MEIRSAQIKFVKKDGFCNTSLDGVRHTKVLPWLSIVQSQTGNYEIKLSNSPAKMTSEGGFFIAPSAIQQTITHHANKQTGIMKCRWLFIDLILNDVVRFDNAFSFPTIVPNEQAKMLNDCFDELFSSADIFENNACYFRILKILFSIATPKTSNNLLLSITDYIENNLSSTITIEDLSNQAHTSPSNLYHIFKKQFGVSPISYLNNLRLSLSAEYLLSSDLSISEISEKVGFSDPFYFSKAFKKAYSLSPREYRNQHK